MDKERPVKRFKSKRTYLSKLRAIERKRDITIYIRDAWFEHLKEGETMRSIVNKYLIDLFTKRMENGNETNN